MPIINQVNCDVLDAQMLGNMLLLEVVMCKEIRVTADVILEVQAKFCGPRQPIPIEQPPFDCPFPTFPPQCPTFFPPVNCECQAAADFSGEATISVVEDGFGGITAGQLDLLAFICDSCNPENSRLEVDYDDTGATPLPTPTPDAPGDQSFTFTATQFEEPTCSTITVGGAAVVNGLDVTGLGVITPAGGAPENASFSLSLRDADVGGVASDTAMLMITSPTMSVTIALTEAANPGLEVEAGDCDRFPDIPTTPAP
uniref:hypothetical protein n=1 Tax=Priestia abyssalis TaxID=1221450 RepID=UPI001115F6F4|nr:hypothetical protein [Priestia abyssalis]